MRLLLLLLLLMRVWEATGMGEVHGAGTCKGFSVLFFFSIFTQPCMGLTTVGVLAWQHNCKHNVNIGKNGGLNALSDEMDVSHGDAYHYS